MGRIPSLANHQLLQIMLKNCIYFSQKYTDAINFQFYKSLGIKKGEIYIPPSNRTVCKQLSLLFMLIKDYLQYLALDQGLYR